MINYVIIFFTGASSKQTVFARLGNSEVAKPVTLKPVSKQIFSRLGSKSEEKDNVQVIPIQKDALKYKGILKGDPIVKKVYMVTASKNNVRKIAVGTMRADESPISVKEKLTLPKPKSVKFSTHVEYKEIEATKKNILNNQVPAPKNPPVNVIKKVLTPKHTLVFNKPERRLSMPEDVGVKSRLGNKSPKDLTITRNVFNRLGV